MSESCKAEAEKVLKEEGEQWCQTEQQQEPRRDGSVSHPNGADSVFEMVGGSSKDGEK